METKRTPRIKCALLSLALVFTGVCHAQNTPPDLTASGAIAALKTNANGNATPVYGDTFNLGSTGLRGWIHLNFNGFEFQASGRISDASRQILVTTASTPGNAVLAVDDVIIGAIAASSGTVPTFTSDARKAFGTAITEAEKTGAGTLRVKRWRAGTTTDVNITIPTLGTYSATAPYNCPKSAQILANTRNQMVGELIANPNYLDSGHSGAINALALLASVPYVVNPSDPNESNYSTARTRLQTYARSLTVPAYQWEPDQETWIWESAYKLLFLSEYYLLTNDSQVVPTINGFTLWHSEFQSMWGTYNHGPGGLLQDGSGRRFANGYGPVNAAGNIANIAIVLGKQALLAASQPIDPKIDAAIQRGSGFLGSYVNKGGIPYGEHTPTLWHASNGKDPSAAVFFGLQANRASETEYFSRMSVAGWVGVEVGHAGQELGLLWATLGAGMGGDAAASGHFRQLLWRYDMHRRTNGSFAHDSGYSDYYGGGSTEGGTYLGNSAASGVKGTAIYLLAYSLPLKQLYITGKNIVPTYVLDSTKVSSSVSAGYFRVDKLGLTIPQLFTFLGHYDPVVRYHASLELAARPLTSTNLTNLRGLLTNPDANTRQSAAETLGIRKDATALPTLVGMLNGPNRDPDHWVRQKVAAAIRNYDASTVSPHRDALINAFIANAPADHNVIDWTDPLQFSNSILSDVLFNQLADSTINAPKTTHLYPALRAGLLLPTGYYRSPVTAFARSRMNLTDLQNLFPELFEVVSADTPADRMFSGGTRADALTFMVENNITEGVEIAFAMFNDPNGFAWGSGAYISVALNALVSYGDAARYTLPRLREVQSAWNLRLWDGGLPHAQLRDTITFLENVTSDPPATNLGKCAASPQIVTTSGAKAITLAGASPRGSFSFQKLTDPVNGTLTGTAPNFTYTPNAGFTGTDKFTFQTTDSLTTSEPATVAIIVGSSGTGIAGAYFDNADFTSPVLTRTDPQINFDWGTGSPAPSIGADTFSTRWSGYLLAPETGTYTLSGLTSDGVRAYLNGVSVINNLNDQSTRWTDGQSISLTAGQKVPLFLEYFENTGSAVAKLKWTGPSFAGLNGSIIPQSYLFETNSSGGTDTTAPVISTLNPADNATGVAHAADLVATFSENIVRGTGNITVRNVSDGTQTVIPVTDTAQVTISGATLLINPTALLVGSKNYAVRIDATAIDDTSGNSFAGIANDTTWNFTTTAPDTTKPTPNPMSFAVPPQTGSSTSITMTATTASDASGVEYRFNNVTLGTSSPWQNSPVYTATGLLPSNNYTFTVQARDKSVAGNTTTASAPASARTLGTGPLDLMSLNFYEYGDYSQSAVTLEAGESAGLGAFHVSGWQNYRISPGAPVTLTSNVGSTATMKLNDVRNGGTHSEFPNPLFAGGDGDLMNAQCHGTEDPYDQSALFNMDVSNIPYPTYDLIVYMGTNSVHGGDRTGKIVLNGGAERDFTLPAGSFNGFTESTNATTPGNYIVFRGLTSPSLNLKAWGNGFNHLGPTGFQIVNYGAPPADTTPPATSSLNPADNATGVAVGANLVATFSENIAIGTGNIILKNLSDANQTTIPVTDAQISISGNVLTINPTANLVGGKSYAVQITATAIKDLANNNFAGISNDTTWNFVTAADTTAPTITNRNPSDNATGVAVGANLVATFSEPIAIGIGNITIRKLSDNTNTNIAVTDATQITISGNILTINPTANLLPNTSYAVRIAATAIKDLANNNFAGIANNTNWNFSTQADGESPDSLNLNFFSYGSLTPANFHMATVEAGESAGVGVYNLTGWQNYEIGFGMDSPADPFTLTSSLGATATMTLNDARNGGTDDDQPNPNFGGSGDMMDGLANGTEDPYDESAKFDMTVSNIPYPVYDLVVYLSGNGGVEGDGTGKLILNGGAVQNFTVALPFNGFVEITNATTPGNYIIFRKLRTPSLTLKVWGNGFNHIGPAGFQIVKDTTGILPPGPASNPNPADTTVGHAFDTNLSWTAGADALSRNVYFGTNPSPGAAEFRGNQTATTFDPGILTNGTYYWRIDEVNGDGVTTGPVWSFSVGPPAKAFRPMPLHNMKAVATNVGTLKWVAGKSATTSSHDVYFGIDSTPDSSEFIGNQSGTTFNPGTLSPGTTYYWRIDQVNAQGTMTGDVWSFTTPSASANKVKVFILVGQSNMVGHGEIEPIGTPGTLQYTYNNDPVTYAHLKNGSNWAVRDDAWIYYDRDGEVLKGGHTVGYGVSNDQIGPELQFGHAMGQHFGEKVLLIKTAWGGKSLQTDFRPPSAGWDLDEPGKVGDKGYYFTEMLKQVLDATGNIQTHFPDYNPADGFEIVGFAWHQGFNDLISESASAEYEANMEKFIKDLRLAVGVPNLPFVIATTGQSDPTNYSTLEQGQLAMENFTKYPDFKGNVAVVDAKPFWIPIESSPADEGYHWNRNAKTYYMIGDSLATEMRALIATSGGGDTTPPETSSLSPANNTSDVAIDANLVANFSETIALGTGNITIKNLTDTTQTTIPVTDTLQISISGTILTINPTTDLLTGKNYAIQIAATAIDDTAGNSFAGITNDNTWNFTTVMPDTTAPTPNPMTFASPPVSTGINSITMTATTATDTSGVEYRFNNLTLGTSSLWQDSPVYTATGLNPATSYTFTVQARDKSSAQNTTTASPSAAATTDAPDTTAPTPNPMSFASPPAATGQTSITMTATTASDPSGVEYYFECTAGAGHSSAWQDSPTYTDTSLTSSTQYTYRVRARDKSPAQNATAWSAAVSATTLVAPRTLYSAGAKTWNTTTANWGTIPSGPYNTATWSAGDSAILEGTSGNVTLGEAISLKSLTFTHTTGTYTVTGSTLNFSTGGSIVTNNPPTNGLGAIIQSNVTGAPTINAFALGGNEQFTLRPAAAGSMSIGAVSGNGGNGSPKLNLEGGAGSSGTIASVTGPKVTVLAGSWTLNGASSGYGHEISAGTLTLNATLTATNRSVNLSGTGIMNYNSANAVAATAATAASGSDNGFRIRTGASLDQTSGTAINTSTTNPSMTWEGNWTFIGTNGANSNLNLGTGNVFLKAANPQVTVTNVGTTLTVGGVIANDATPGRGLTKAGAGTLELRGANAYSGATTVSAGKLLVNGNQSTASGNVSVEANATLGGTGIIGGNTTIATNGKLEFNLSTAAASHDKLELTTGKSLTFSGDSTLTITGTAGASPGTYTLITAPGGITGSAPSTLNLPSGWAATVDKVGNDLVLNLTSTSVGPGPVASFEISAIASPQTVGTPITGITLTAKDAANATATSFTGTVNFGGTGGFIGTSANFTAGMLTGVSVTPTLAGSNLTFTVSDGASHTGSITIANIKTAYENWAIGGAGFNHDTNNDGVPNGLAFLLGASDVNQPAADKLPKTSNISNKLRLTFRCMKTAKRGGVTLKIQTSSDLGVTDPWTNHEVIIPDTDSTVNGVVFDTTLDGDYIHVIADIPVSEGKIFSRLHAEISTRGDAP